jgi:phytoene dehydrogenase-like protein
MSGPYDIVALGAGHNGLVAAAYLAKVGKKVLVLERKAWPGGGVATRELTVPGYWHDEHSSVHIMIQGNPMLTRDELGLIGKFGLKYIYSDIPHVTIFDDQSTIISYKGLDKTCQSIAKVWRRTPRPIAASRSKAPRCCRCSSPGSIRRRCRWRVHGDARSERGRPRVV